MNRGMIADIEIAATPAMEEAAVDRKTSSCYYVTNKEVVQAKNIYVVFVPKTLQIKQYFKTRKHKNKNSIWEKGINR